MNLTFWIPIGVAFTSAAGAFIGTWFSAKKNALTTQRQLKLQVTMKIADYRQAWINELRDSMAEFQSYGVTPDLEHAKERDFYKLGSKIELLMNPSDPDYGSSEKLLYQFLTASTIDEKYSCNAEFIRVAQSILKREWDNLKTNLEKTDQV